MKTKIVILFFVIIGFNNLTAQNNFVFSIPKEVAENADAVVRSSIINVEMVSVNRMTITVDETITIFNNKGSKNGILALFYDKQTSVQQANLEYFDAIGNSIRKIKKSDLNDFAAVDGFSLYNDDRVLVYVNPPQQFPYTVHKQYKISTSNTAFFPHWTPMEDFNTGVEYSTLNIKYPVDIKLNYTKENFDVFSVETIENQGQIQFVLKNKPPIKEEDYCPTFRKLAPWSQISANRFNLAGVEGSANSWDEYAMWMYKNLLSTRNNLSEETKIKIKSLVANAKTPFEKAAIVYDYVQNKVRYVSVQIGIGGWMPMMTNEVDKLSYGDCKALTFYTYSLLQEVGVPAQYALVYASEQPTDINPNIVSTQGNHAFLMIPQEKDTVFLECTSQKLGFGVTGNATRNRKVLAINEQGGKIIQTPKIVAEKNSQTSQAQCTLNENGNVTATIDVVSKENQYAQRLYHFDGLQPDDKKNAYKAYFGFLNNISFQEIETLNNKKEKQFEEHLKLSISGYSVVQSDKSIIFNPNLFNRTGEVPVKIVNRVHPLVLQNEYQDIDNYTINIPDHYMVEGLPLSISYDNEFGKYDVKITQDGQQIIYQRNLTIYSGTFPKEQYEVYRAFLRNIKKSDETKLLLTPKQ